MFLESLRDLAPFCVWNVASTREVINQVSEIRQKTAVKNGLGGSSLLFILDSIISFFYRLDKQTKTLLRRTQTGERHYKMMCEKL